MLVERALQSTYLSFSFFFFLSKALKSISEATRGKVYSLRAKIPNGLLYTSIHFNPTYTCNIENSK